MSVDKIKMSEALQKMKEAQEILKREYEKASQEGNSELQLIIEDAINGLGESIGITDEFVNNVRSQQENFFKNA